MTDTGNICPQCKKGNLVIKTGRYGNFTACSNFPDCKYIAKENKTPAQDTGIPCDKCGEGMFVIRGGQYGNFMACNRFPKCKNTKKIGPDGQPMEPKAKFPK